MARNQPTALLVETECIEKDPGLTGLKEETGKFRIVKYQSTAQTCKER